MNIAERAYTELFGKEPEREMKIRYSGHFRPYNASVRYNAHQMTFNLAREWKTVGEEIKLGLFQSLLLKVHKEKKNTLNIDLYNSFLKNMSDYGAVTESDPLLEASFERVNQKYFDGLMDKPNLRFGNESFSKLGTYEYGANTVTISTVLIDDEELLDYVVYHELLHKKHKFQSKNGTSRHHTTAFRKDEHAFENPNVEEKLKRYLAKKRFSLRFRRKKDSAGAAKTKKGGLLGWFFE